MTDSERFDRAIAAIDAGNADDPNVVTIRGRTGPKEILHAELVTEWVQRLAPGRERAAAARRARSPLPALDRAARDRRRPGAPATCAGASRSRSSTPASSASCSRPRATTPDTIARVQAIVRKEGLADDAEVQVLEDALCLVFLETQLADVVARLDPDTLDARARAHRAEDERGRAAPRSPTCRSTTTRARCSPAALARDVVERYLAGLAAHDWDAVAATLAPDVERMGPYRDAYRGREPYADVPRRDDRRARRVPARRRPRARGRPGRDRRAAGDRRRRRRPPRNVAKPWCSTPPTGSSRSVAVYLQTSERHPRAARAE